MAGGGVLAVLGALAWAPPASLARNPPASTFRVAQPVHTHCQHPTPPGRARVAAIGLQPEDVPLVAAGALIAVGAGALQLSLASGKRGLGAFLAQEKSKNPFYSRTFKADEPQPPAWWPEWLRLPELDYVEVYGQEPRRPTGVRREMDPAELESSRRELERLMQVDVDAELGRGEGGGSGGASSAGDSDGDMSDSESD